MTELTIHPRVAQWAVQSIGRLLASFGILQGLNIIFGGIDRWGADSFKVALLLPGAPPSWGVVILAAGLTALIGSIFGRYTPVFFGMAAGSAWSMFFTIAFALAAFANETASTTGVWAYGTFSVLYALIAVVYRESRKTRGARAVHRDNSRQSAPVRD